MTERQTDSNLIFDVGLHRGEDTAFYLRKGFRVVAFEANPDLVAHCHRQFAREIDEGALTIVAGAIISQQELLAGKTSVAFYRNEGLSVWGTIRKDWAERNESLGAPSTRIEVPVVDFGAALRKYGVPYYMKIDIEGCDTVCLDALQDFPVRPIYVSIESSKSSLKEIRDEIQLLERLGYDAFHVVEQSQLHLKQKPPVPAKEGHTIDYTFLEGASGLFGKELPGEWLDRKQTLRRYRMICFLYWLYGDSGWINRINFRGSGRIKSAFISILNFVVGRRFVGWYDTHARHSASAP